LYEDPPETEAYAAFAKELAERERKLKDYLDGKYRELVDGARSRAGEYLLACHALRNRPPMEDYMLLADTNDLNPTMIIRYQGFLERRAKAHDPVLAVWHALAALDDKDFEAQASGTVARLIAAATPEAPINPLVAGAFLGRALKARGDASAIYGALLSGADKLWRAELERAEAAGAAPPAALADANLEALRQVLYGPESPSAVARNELNWLTLLPDRPSQEERKKLLAIEQQTDTRSVNRVAHDIRQTLDNLRHAKTHRHVKHFFREFDRTFHFGAAAGEHDARRHQLLEAAAT
jgi:hypothetical protein